MHTRGIDVGVETIGGADQPTPRQALRARTLVALALSTVSGCATIDMDRGFPQVAGEVEQRIGREIRWSSVDGDDEAARARVRGLLSGPIDAGGAVQIALANNRRLQATFEELGVSHAALVQASLIRNPVLEGALRLPLGGGTTELDLGLAQDVLSLFLQPLRRRIAESEFEETKLRVIGAVMELAFDTRVAFLYLQAAERLRDQGRRVVRATDASLVAAERLHEAGNITDLELLQRQLTHHESRLDLAAEEREVAGARERLNALMGLWGDETRWTAVEGPPALPADAADTEDAERRAVESNLSLAAARHRIEGLARRLGLADTTALVPDLQTGASAERQDREWDVGPALSLPIPLFDTGHARRAAAGAELRRARQEYAALAVEVRAAVRGAREQLVELHRSAAYLRDVVLPLSERVLTETVREYNAMQSGVFALLIEEQRQIELTKRVIASLRDYWIADAAFEQMVNGHVPALVSDIDGGGTPARMNHAPAE